jgi:ribokinase
MTRGAAGAIVSDASGTVLVASPKVAAVDSSGAGDAFVGALAAGLAAGASLLDAAQDAVRVGAFSVTGVGTQASYPTLEDELPAAAVTS